MIRSGSLPLDVGQDLRLASSEERMAEFPSLGIVRGGEEVIHLFEVSMLWINGCLNLSNFFKSSRESTQYLRNKVYLRVHVELPNETLPIIVLEVARKHDPIHGEQ